MAKMGSYCKAYPLRSLRTFEGWAEKSDNARREKKPGEDGEAPRTLGPMDFLYLQENYVVTDGVFIEENVIYDDITPGWIEFCRSTLKFEVPAYAHSKPIG
jgi:hypothetical protein